MAQRWCVSSWWLYTGATDVATRVGAEACPPTDAVRGRFGTGVQQPPRRVQIGFDGRHRGAGAQFPSRQRPAYERLPVRPRPRVAVSFAHSSIMRFSIASRSARLSGCTWSFAGQLTGGYEPDGACCSPISRHHSQHMRDGRSSWEPTAVVLISRRRRSYGVSRTTPRSLGPGAAVACRADANGRAARSPSDSRVTLQPVASTVSLAVNLSSDSGSSARGLSRHMVCAVRYRRNTIPR